MCTSYPELIVTQQTALCPLGIVVPPPAYLGGCVLMLLVLCKVLYMSWACMFVFACVCVCVWGGGAIVPSILSQSSACTLLSAHYFSNTFLSPGIFSSFMLKAFGWGLGSIIYFHFLSCCDGEALYSSWIIQRETLFYFVVVASSIGDWSY